MLFSVIVSIDHPSHPARIIPKRLRKTLRGSLSASEYRYLAKESADPENDPWRHAKGWQGAAILTRSEFDELFDALGCHRLETATMGTLGGPLGYGVVPDVALECEPDSYDGSYIVSARVTPVSRYQQEADTEEQAERTWQRISGAFCRAYRDGTSPRETRLAQYRDENGSRYPWNIMENKLRAIAKRIRRTERAELRAFLAS